jgi:ribonuclease HII
LKADPRPGAKAILAAIDRRHFANRSEGQRLRKLLRYECALWQTGIMHVAGVDEAGMSPLAGPVAAAAVIFAPGSRIPGVNDSKKLDACERDRLAVEIKGTAVAWSVAFSRGGRNRHTQYLLGGHSWHAESGRRDCKHRPEHVLTDARRIKDLPIAQQPSSRAIARASRLRRHPFSPKPRAMA